MASAIQSAVLMFQFEPMAAEMGVFRELQQGEAGVIRLVYDAVGKDHIASREPVLAGEEVEFLKPSLVGETGEAPDKFGRSPLRLFDEVLVLYEPGVPDLDGIFDGWPDVRFNEDAGDLGVQVA